MLLVTTCTRDTWRLGRRPELDGLRAIAITLVLVCHTFYGRYVPLGSAGVTLFFTLSGFLITRLLLEETADRGRISLSGFYARRARRLLPALFVMLAVVLGLATLDGVRPSWVTITLILTYAANLSWVQQHGQPGLTHMWTLSVEEQFYLLWPLAILLVHRLARQPRRVLTLVAWAGIAVGATTRVVAYGTGHAGFAYLATPARADAMLVGALAALYVTSGRQLPTWSVPAALAALVAVGLLPGAGLYVVAPTVIPWLTAAVLLVIADRSVRALRWAPMTALGRVSYSLYLWHLPVLFFLWWLPTDLRVAIVWPLALGIAVLSRRYVELPFLRIRAKTLATPVGGFRDAVTVSA